MDLSEVATISLDNIASLLSDDSDSENESKTATKNKTKNKNKKRKAKKQTSSSISTSTSSSEQTLSTGSLTTTTTTKNQSQPSTLTTTTTTTTTKPTIDKNTQRFQQQRKLQFLTEAFRHAKDEAIKFKQQLQNQSSSNQQQMIEKAQQQAKNRLSRRAALLDKKASQHISLESLRTNAAALHLVDEEDRHAIDPYLLIFLKSYLANIRLSREWAQKRRLYSNKHGNEKTDFFIPNYIESLNARHLVQKEDKTTKQELAAMARARIGKHNIDYQSWNDAFYINMPRIKFDTLENIQYEGKNEYEQYSHMSPFDPLSTELQRALGMINTTNTTPLSTISIMPPWIPNMQQYGPPPAYPNAYIPGVNAPLPPGGSWGPFTNNYSQSITWGMPPIEHKLDSNGQPQQIPRWGGDPLGQSGFMRTLQSLIMDKYRELSLEEKNDDNDTTTKIDSNPERKPSLTGIWYPMPKIAPPNNDMSLLLTTTTPLQRQTLEDKFNYATTSFGKTTPSLFGAIDYVGFEAQQAALAQQEFLQQHQPQPQKSQPQTSSSSITTTTTTTDSTSTTTSTKIEDADEKWRQEQRATQLAKALPQHIQHLMSTDANPIQPTGNMAPSSFAQQGQLFSELELTSNGIKRKGIPKGDVNDDDVIEDDINLKRQRPIQ